MNNMNQIDPEDFEWSNECDEANFNTEKRITNSFPGIINDSQYCHFSNTQPLYEDTISNINSIHSAEEKCYTSLGESELKLCNKNSLEELRSLAENETRDALNCLYRNEEQSIDLGNVEQGTKGNPISYEEGFLVNNKSRSLISSNLKADCFKENTLLNAETISLISNSISGVYEPPESFSSFSYRSTENEQVVPINNYVTFDENGNPQAPESKILNLPNQHEPVIIDQYTSENNETSNSTNIIKEDVNSISITNEASIIRDLSVGIQSLEFDGISAYTPGGQCYKLLKRSNFSSKTKVAINENRLEIAALLNNCKKIRQIQCGVWIPENVDYNKEEDFNNWLRKEKDKTKSLFENFKIELNINISSPPKAMDIHHLNMVAMKYLAVERELIKLDRYLKQYSVSNFHDPLEILEFIEKTDVDLTNLVYTYEVYKTLSKITKNCKGRLRVKAKAILTKLQSLLLPTKGIKAERYLNDLVIRNSVNKLNLEAPAEWIVHLLIFV